MNGKSLSVRLLALFAATLCTDASAQTLREVATKNNFLFGSAAWESGTNGHEVAYTDTLKREFNLITTRAQLCMGIVQPSRGSFNFVEADKVFAFAAANGQKVYAHCILSAQDNAATLPGWILNGGFDRGTLLGILRTHIHTVMNRYKGQVAAWNVVNEPVQNGFWSQKIGSDWVAHAIRYAREIEPTTDLIVNEYGIEAGPASGSKWTSFFNLMKSLRAEGVVAAGFQGYFGLDYDLTQTANAIGLMRDIGVKVHITELGILVGTSTPSADQLNRQASQYLKVLRLCRAASNCGFINVWGVTDKLHWMVVSQGRSEAPLLFDRAYAPKPAYFALRDELAASVPANPAPSAPTSLAVR